MMNPTLTSAPTGQPALAAPRTAGAGEQAASARADAIRAHLPAALVALSATLVGALIFARFLFPYAVPVGFDESYMVPFAERLIDGHFVPYVDAVSQRGPFLYWVLALAQLVFGRYEWVGIRVVTLVGCLLTVGATTYAGVAARRPLAGRIGGAALVLVIAVHGGPRACCGEAIATPCLALAFCLLSLALREAPRADRPRSGLLALAGVAAALAALAKQTTAVACVPFVLWAAAHAFTTDRARPNRKPYAWLAGPLAFVAGALGTVTAAIAWFAAHHALAEFVYWSSTYNATIYMAPFKARYWHILFGWLGVHVTVVCGVLGAAAFAVIRPLWAAREGMAAHAGTRMATLATAYARTGFEVTAALQMVLLFGVALMPARFWWHYFMVVWPWLGVLAGVLIELALARLPGEAWMKHAFAAVPLAALVLAAGAVRLATLEDQRAAGAFKNPRPNAVCKIIDQHAAPGESIFVWGFDGDVYINCRRRPASRFTYLTLVAGIVPPQWGTAQPERVGRGARETLLADLEQGRPAMIVDYPIHAFAMDHVPALADLLARDYCALPEMRGGPKRKPKLYVRRDTPVCPVFEAPEGGGPEGDTGSALEGNR